MSGHMAEAKETVTFWREYAAVSDAEVARLTRERDAALDELKHAAVKLEEAKRYIASRRARQTIQAIETGAIHNDQS